MYYPVAEETASTRKARQALVRIDVSTVRNQLQGDLLGPAGGAATPWQRMVNGLDEGKAATGLTFVVSKLALPTEGACFRADFFGFGDHALLLIKDRQARVGQFILRRRLD